MSDPKRDQLPSLGPSRSDRSAAVARSIAGAVPFAGAAIAEIITEIIPNQRVERIEAYLKLLAEKVVSLSIDNMEHRFKQREAIDLLEDGAVLAARALTEERMGYIANCVANGIASTDRQTLRQKRLLNIVGQLDDEEILILNAYNRRDPAAFKNLRPPPATIAGSEEVLRQNAMYDAARDKLERLSLIRFRSRTKNYELAEDSRQRPSRVKIADLDSSGKPRGRYDITTLGRMVIESIGLSEAEEPQSSG